MSFTKQPDLLAKIQLEIWGAGWAIGSDTNRNPVVSQKFKWKRLPAKPFMGCGAMDNRDPVFL